MIQASMKKKDFTHLVHAIIQDGLKVYGPTYKDDSVILTTLNRESEVVFTYSNMTLPGKRIFFPQSEVMFTYDNNRAMQPEMPEQGMVIFGLRPCDTLALTYLDKVFATEDCVDPYYSVKRYNSLIITYACSEMSETCFCTSTGGSPVGNDGADVMVYEVGNALLFEAISEAGNNFIEQYSGLFDQPGEEEIQQKNDLISQAEHNGKDKNLSDIQKRMKALSSMVPPWEGIANRCLGCGICTYMCPTCHCFTIHDETSGKTKKRIRVHDSCSFKTFSREASGHNPQKDKKNRIKQRIMHKFDYSVKNFNEIFCVGCGRCIQYCPAQVDIRDIIVRGHMYAV